MLFKRLAVFSGREGGGLGAGLRAQRPSSLFLLGVLVSIGSSVVRADSPFATNVLDYGPAPGQFVNDSQLNDANKSLGAPSGGGSGEGNELGVVTLGGFGGTITLAFDHTVRDDHANPFGLDAIVFGNAFWAAANANRRWAETGIIEISRDANSNGLADDPWFLIPGSHVTDPVGQYSVMTWDSDLGDGTFPPANPFWVPAGSSGTWTTEGYKLQGAPFDGPVLENPNGLAAEVEGVFGFADLSPVALLPDGIDAEDFYVRPDDALKVGLTDGSAGGDGFDIAWAIDPATGADAELDGFDFVRITTAVDFIAGALGEVSTEIDAVADVAETFAGDVDGDGDVDLDDHAYFVECLQGPESSVPTSPCRPLDFDDDGDVDLVDACGFQIVFGMQAP
ncbi:MAG: hypothetical protein DHS20C16_00600 [Phycisphaerae bacterium]|nr:MAG: hypothetical protein DHS20C16_00600 [Phycisphaerae bacterium]